MRRGWAGRGVLAGIAAAVGALAVLGSGADRLAASGVGFPGPGWPMFGPERLRMAGRAAARANDLATARDVAIRAVAAAPMEAPSLSLLGTVAIRADDLPAADAAFRVAGSLGWRDVPTQAYLIAVALRAGDARVAVERADALLRTGRPYREVAGVLRQAERSPDGAAALAQRLSYTPGWAGSYVVGLGDGSQMGVRRRLEILRAASAGGLMIDCRWGDEIAWSLASRGNAPRAYEIWQRLGCGGAGPVNLDARAGRFDETGYRPVGLSIFNWSLASDSSLETRFDSAPGGAAGNAVAISTDSPAARLAVRRTVILSPGRYRLNWTAAGMPGESRPDLIAEAICFGNGRPLAILPATASGDAGARVLEVPSQGCSAQEIRFSVATRTGARQRLWLDDVSLTRMS